MLAHDIKNMLTILPDLQPLIKEANIEEDYPLDNKDGVIASYLRYQYLTKVAGKLGKMNPEFVEQLEKAAAMYGLKDTIKPFVERLEKYASIVLKEAMNKYNQINIKTAEAMFEGKTSGFTHIPTLVKEAKELCQVYGDQVTSEEVLRYAGKLFFVKKAAVQALQGRAAVTGKKVFTKFAEIIDNSMEDVVYSEREVNDVCSRVVELDEKMGLSARGLNFYKEAMVPRRRLNSVLGVKVCGKSVPYEKIAMLGGSRIGSYLGKDVGDAITGDPMNDKAVIESLPMDSQHILSRMLGNV